MESSAASLLPGPEDFANSQNIVEKYIQKVFPDFKFGSFVGYLSILQVFLYLLTSLFSLLKHFHLSYIVEIPVCTLYTFGSTNGASFVQYFQVYRLLTPMLLHANIFHLFVNICSQIQLVLLIEANNYLQKRNIVHLYIVSGMGASLFSMALYPERIAVGASGALFGLLGYLCIELWLLWEALDENFRKSRATVLGVVLVVNIILTLGSPVIDSSAHFFGLGFGALMTFILLSNTENPFEEIPGLTTTKYRVSFAAVVSLMLIGLALLYVEGSKAITPSC